jgi:hypothetical protein
MFSDGGMTVYQLQYLKRRRFDADRARLHARRREAAAREG